MIPTELMKLIQTLVILICLQLIAFAQVDPDADIFKDFTPKWAHVTRDSSYKSDLYNGINHLFFPVLSSELYTENQSINVYNYFYELWSGFLIEKIDLETGKTIWIRKVDLTNNDRKEYCYHYGLDSNNDLLLLSYRSVDSLTGLVWSRAKVAQRKYDFNTGRELYYYAPPLDQDSLYPRTSFNYDFYQIYPAENGGYFHILPDGDSIEYIQIINQFDKYGSKLSTRSLSCPKRYKWYSNSGLFYTQAKFAKFASSYNSSPSRVVNYSEPFEMVFDFYNDSLQWVRRLDLHNKLGPYYSINPLVYDDYIWIARVDSVDIEKGIPGVMKSVKVDYQGNIISQIRMNRVPFIHSESYCRLKDDQGHLVVRCLDERISNPSNPYVLEFTLLQDGSEPKLLKRISLKDYYAMIYSRVRQLENGDIVLLGKYALRKEMAFDQNKSSFITISIPSSDLGLQVGIREEQYEKTVQLEPNPANEQVVFRNPKLETGMLQFFDGKGVCVIQKWIIEEQNPIIKTDGLVPGNYWVQWTPQNGPPSEAIKLIISR